MRNSQSLHVFLVTFAFPLLSILLCPSNASSGSDYDYGAHPRFVCTPIPVDADPACFPTGGPGVGAAGPGGPGHQSSPHAGWWGASEEAKATILHLRESLVQQKETILDQRETIRELTAKLTLCEGLGRGATSDDGDFHGAASHARYGDQQGRHGNLIPDSPHFASVGRQRADGAHGVNHQGKDKHATPGDITSSPEQMERMLQALKERLDNLQKRNTSITYSSSLKELLQRKINALEQQLRHHGFTISGPDRHHKDGSHRDDGEHHHDDDDEHLDGNHRDDDGHPNDHKDDHNDGGHSDNSNHTDPHDDSHGDDHHDADTGRNHGHHHDDADDDRHSNEGESHSYASHTGYGEPAPRTGFHSNKLEAMLNQLHLTGSARTKFKSPDAFQISFPMRTNYMSGRVKRTLMQEIFALTLCLWIKAGVAPGLGTPFSYSAPGQANELVLIEWGTNPMELLIDDKAVTLPLSLEGGEWHHVCVTWSTRDGQWEAYQDGVQKGSGVDLSPWHPIKPGGVFILGQEQDTLGGRFDATQSFVGEMSDVHMWSHVLTASDIYSLASCGSHLRGDVIAWSEAEVELFGGVAKYPFDPCH
ncbi:neuronal pentraxin-2 isoform 1-T4 [Spinachia spinachia]